MPSLRSWLIVAALALPISLSGDSGVLIPSGRPGPDPSVLSLDELVVDVRIDNGDARVSLRQIFASHVAEVLEGEYLFSLPSRATVSDFAVWDGVVRIPGVILERRRAEEIYANLAQQQIDPGLLQAGEQGTEGPDEAARTSLFSARIVPIAGHGTKRLELEYHETLPVENLRSVFSLPLRPDAYNAQVARRLRLTVSLDSAHAIRDVQVPSRSYPLRIESRTPHRVSGSFVGENVSLAEDFSIEYTLDGANADRLAILTHRNPAPAPTNPTQAAPAATTPEPGFFQASALLAAAEPSTAAAAAAAPAPRRTVVALLDTSLSMQWDKLERGVRGVEAVLRSLQPADAFNLVLFNTETAAFAPAPVAAEVAAIEKALAFVRAGRLRGGTDLERGLGAGLDQLERGAGDRYLVVLSDASATRGPIANARLGSWYAARRNALPASVRPRTYVLGIGDDANVPLLKMLSRDEGVIELVRSTEPLDFKLQAFVAKIGARPLEQLRLTVDPTAAVDLVYPLEPASFAGSMASWVGQYAPSGTAATFTLQGLRHDRPLQIRADAPLPAESLGHEALPRTWARARVDALLDAIARDGESRAAVDEIIALARKYKFVTPYTSFLAAPRALLRPRVIKPGDPVIRVATDESIASVVALFPFGLVKKLRYLPEEKMWQTRFLAPADMRDGTYQVRLVLRDRAGRTYREAKSFVIASQPPTLKVSVDRAQARAGDVVRLRALASQSTRTIVARLYGAMPVDLRWDAGAAASIGSLTVPESLPPGRYAIRVTAEDMAHNTASREVALDVVP